MFRSKECVKISIHYQNLRLHLSSSPLQLIQVCLESDLTLPENKLLFNPQAEWVMRSNSSDWLMQNIKTILGWEQVEGFLKIDTLCFELSHSIESSLRSLSAM